MVELKFNLFDKFDIDSLFNCKIPEKFFDKKYSNYIKQFNNISGICDFSNFFNDNDELLNYETNFKIEVLDKINKFIYDIYKDYFELNEDFNYFVNRFNKEYFLLNKQIDDEYKICKEQTKQAINNSFNIDISCGIFSSTESFQRKFFHEIKGVEYSAKLNNLIREKKFIISNFYSYLYVKTEQILFFFYKLFNEKSGEKIYLFTKYLSFLKNKILNIDKTKFKKEKMDKLNAIWKFYKHQKPLPNEINVLSYKKDFIDESINFVKGIYDSLLKILNLKNFLNKIENYDLEIQGILNPLG